MQTLVIDPIYVEEPLWAGIAKEVESYFDEAIFDQLYAVLRDEDLKVRVENALGDAVTAGLKSRRIWYTDGVFFGRFNAAISRELRQIGASWDEQSSVFRISASALPAHLRLAAAQSTEAAKKTAQKILDVLDQMESNLKQAKTGIRLVGPINDLLDNLNKQLGKTLTAQSVGVPADLTESTRAEIAERYTENMELLIKDFAKSRIPALREKIQQNVFDGARTDKLVKIIQAEQGMSKRKATFLAEQESSLLVSKYRESRYKAIGSKRYVWKTSRDVRVRHDHAELNNKIFSWDDPPITNKATGERNNPGEDFGCRCVARPIVVIK